MLKELELDRLIPAVPQQREALEQIYRAGQRELFAFAYGILREPQAAEDAVSETMVRLYRCAGQYRPGNGRAYLYRICRNVAMEMLRHRKRQIPTESVPETASDAPGEDRVLALQLLAGLSPTERQVMVLRYYGDLTFKEIARVLGEPEGTVKWRHTRALKKCREQAQ